MTNETDLGAEALRNIEQAERDEEQRPQKEREAVVERELEDVRRGFLASGGTEEEFDSLRPALRRERIAERAVEAAERAKGDAFGHVLDKF